MDDRKDVLPQTLIENEFYSLFADREIGSGMSRIVFANKLDKTSVLKVENRTGFFQNIHEWDMWKAVEYNEHCNKWFAPCIAISACGCLLMMKRVKPITKDQMPEKMPSFFTDYKVQNFGLYEGRVVACDYGNFSNFHFGNVKPRLVKTSEHIWSYPSE